MSWVRHVALFAAVVCSIAHGQDGPAWPRPRRQFLGSEWVPISQPCPTCRPVADPGDVRGNVDEIGLVPPRPPTTRQIHGSGNFFPQAPSLLQNSFAPQRQHFQEFLNFNPNVVPFPSQQQPFFTPQQQQSFLPQTYLNNPQLLLNENPQLLPLVNNPQILLAQQKQQSQQNAPQNTVPSDTKESQIRFRPEAQKSQGKPPQNIRLDQQKSEGPLTRLELPLNSPPTQFNSLATSFQQQQQQPFNQFGQLTPEMQSLLQINPSDPFLTPPPFRPNNSDIVIPGLDKEEIQLLYVPVETLRQRGHLQGHTLDDPKPAFVNQPFQQFQQFSQPPTGHFITQQPNPSPLPQFSPSPTPQFPSSPPPRFSPSPAPQFPSSPPPRFSPSPAPQFPSSPPPRFTPSPAPQFPSSPPPRFSPSPAPQFPSSPIPQFSPSPAPQLLASPSPSPPLTQDLPSRDPPQLFAPPSPQPSSTTEQVVTIQSRPVSTVRQPDNIRLTPRPSSRPTERPLTTLPHRSSPFTASTKVTENFSNEITPSFSRNSLPPTPSTESPFQQLQNKPIQHRFTPRPVETVTEITIPTTTLQPHQPPLSIYMGSLRGDVKVIDVLRALKNANTIPVLDNFAPNDPRVFVGPANLNTPPGYGKFELPYLSSLDLNRIERKINLPFFVAPLNFNPPEGYTKIPFPAPHVGSVVVSTETEMSQATLSSRGTTSEPILSEQVNSVEPDPTTLQPEVTTTVRTRGRRPSQYRTTAKKPVTNTRQRVTPRPQEEETTFPVQENQASTQDFLREPHEERKRGPSARRQRLKTTTESTTEAITTESSLLKHNVEPQGPLVELNAQLVDFDQPQNPSHILQEPVLPPSDFRQQQQKQQRVPSVQSHNEFAQVASPPTSDFRQPPSEQFIPDYRPQHVPSFQNPQFSNHGSFQQSQQEVQGIFEVPPPPGPHVPFIENNGNSGFNQPSGQEQIVPTEQPISSTQYSEPPVVQTANPVEAEYETEVTTRPASTSSPLLATQSEPDAENIDKESDSQVDIPKKTSRFSYPNVPGVKSNPSTTKVRSHVRSRPRGSQSFSHSSTTPTTNDEPAHVDVSATADDGTTPSPDATRTTSKYLSHFNRSRKPLRPTTARSETTTTASATTRTYTVRPLRRSTMKTSVSTKRIRKPTTPSPLDEEENEGADPVYAKKTQGNFAPSAASNEINDEQTIAAPKPKVRKTYYQKKKTTESVDSTSPSPSTKTYQERRDEGLVDDTRDEESRTHEFSSPSANDATLSPSALSGPSGSDAEGSKKDERKKFSDSDKKARRRLRVRVQKRPHDNFETAESQNHGAVANTLSSPVKPSAPDLYQFNKGEFDFESSGKFIGTQQKGYVRNITADILENTSTFSAPGADAEVSRVTIATEPTTIIPEVSNAEEVSESTADMNLEKSTVENAIKFNETQEVTTQSHDTTKYFSDVETTEEQEMTTVNAEDLTTVTVEAPTSTSSPEPQEPKQRKVLRTSTTTQVSRETEICYKGKCIKTNSDNPDQALKRLVESANLEEAAAKTKT